MAAIIRLLLLGFGLRNQKVFFVRKQESFEEKMEKILHRIVHH